MSCSPYISASLTNQAIDHYNKAPEIKTTETFSFPKNRNEFLPLGQLSYALPKDTVLEKAASLQIPFHFIEQAEEQGSNLLFSSALLADIGLFLAPYCNYGLFNGGSSTSYFDPSLNRKLSPELFHYYRPLFNQIPQKTGNFAKASLSALYTVKNNILTPGPTYMEWHLKSLYNRIKSYQKVYGLDKKAYYPVFQSTNRAIAPLIEHHLEELRRGPLLSLIRQTHIDLTQIESQEQYLLALFSAERPATIIKKEHPLALPGGHGQGFIELKETLQHLYNQGSRYVALGNIDNLAYHVNPEEWALLALSGRTAAFYFTPKSALDFKGGVLVENSQNRLTCLDLHTVLPSCQLPEDRTIYFNCAIGLFDLEMLLKRIDFIDQHLPMRFNLRHLKGQQVIVTERLAWEVIALMEHFSIYIVPPANRLIASKTLIATFVNSALNINEVDYPFKKEALLIQQTIRDKARRLGLDQFFH